MSKFGILGVRRIVLAPSAALILVLAAWAAGSGQTSAFAPVTVRCPSSRRRPSQPLPSKKTLALAQTTTSLRTSVPDAFTDPIFIEHMATGGALAFAGDVIAQSLTSGEKGPDGTELSIPPKDWDTTRTWALVTFGALYTGGAQHFIFGWLNGAFTEPLQRLLLAQFCFIPFCYYPTFLLMVPALRAGLGPDAAATRERLTSEVLSRLPATLLRNWCFWLPVQFVQFSFIPTDLQVTYCAAFGVIWNAILSWSTMQSSEDVAAEK